MTKKILFLGVVIATFFSCEKKINVVTPPNALAVSTTTSHCGDYVVYTYGKYKKDTITLEIRNFYEDMDTISFKERSLPLFSSGVVPPKASVAINTYSNYPPFSFCPGIIPVDYDPKVSNTWTSTNGELLVKVVEKPTQENLPLFAPTIFKVNLTLKNVTLKNTKGETIIIDALEFKEVLTGGPIPG